MKRWQPFCGKTGAVPRFGSLGRLRTLGRGSGVGLYGVRTQRAAGPLMVCTLILPVCGAFVTGCSNEPARYRQELVTGVVDAVQPRRTQTPLGRRSTPPKSTPRTVMRPPRGTGGTMFISALSPTPLYQRPRALSTKACARDKTPEAATARPWHENRFMTHPHPDPFP